MSDLTAVYCELSLRNPVLVSSAAGVADLETAKEYARAGAGALTLAPISDTNGSSTPSLEPMRGDKDPEALDYAREIGTRLASERTTALIRELTGELDIPIIASLRCGKRKWWTVYARQAARAGARAIELDLLNHNGSTRAEQWERRALGAVDAVRSAVELPIIVKVPYSLTCLDGFVRACKDAGARTILLTADRRRLPVDPRRLERGEAMLSGDSDRQGMQYWLAELYRNAGVELAADLVTAGPEAASAILAGAHTVYFADPAGGAAGLASTVRSLQRWMESHTFSDLHDARGRLSQWERQKLFESRG